MKEDQLPVRLSKEDLNALQRVFRAHFLEDDHLWVFGSRADLSRKGGDLDLYIETHASSVADATKREAHFRWALEDEIGEQKIDIVLNLMKFPHPLKIHAVAKSEGVLVVAPNHPKT